MHWAATMQKIPGMKSFSARHEHCACAMAWEQPGRFNDIVLDFLARH
jgi:hypothetical protein